PERSPCFFLFPYTTLFRSGFFVGNPDLKAESSASAEAGADLTLSTFTASATVFRQSFDNLIRNVQVDTTGRQIFRNLGRSRATGDRKSTRLNSSHVKISYA